MVCGVASFTVYNPSYAENCTLYAVNFLILMTPVSSIKYWPLIPEEHPLLKAVCQSLSF
jgi:hypothetical protein